MKKTAWNLVPATLKPHAANHAVIGSPNPPINIDIIIEDVINIPWKVILELYWRNEHSINPGKANSNRNIFDIISFKLCYNNNKHPWCYNCYSIRYI